MRFGGRDGAPRLEQAAQAGSARLRLTRRAANGPAEALLLNTAGGLAAGDSFHIEAAVRGSALDVASVACERVYRSDGPAAEVRQTLSAGAGGTLRFLPQPTIAFDGAALDRLTTVSLDDKAWLTLCEGVVLGRAAMGEQVGRLSLQDRLEVRLAGRLALVEALRLTDASLARSGPAGLAGARGLGLLVHRGADLDGALQRARTACAGLAPPTLAGASLVNGILVARILAPDHSALQDALARLVYGVSGRGVPRAWRL